MVSFDGTAKWEPYRTPAAPAPDLYDTTDGKIKKYTVNADLFDIKVSFVCEGFNSKETYSMTFEGDKEPEEKRFYKHEYLNDNNGEYYLDKYIRDSIRIGYLIIDGTRIPIGRLIKVTTVEKVSHNVKYDWYQAQV